ncbi:hypothetical protein C0J52_13391, partial [Blattella germanica]
MKCCDSDGGEINASYLEESEADDIDSAFFDALVTVSGSDNMIDIRIFKYVVKQKDDLISELKERINNLLTEKSDTSKSERTLTQHKNCTQINIDDTGNYKSVIEANTISSIPNTVSENNSSEFSPITKYSDIVKSSNGHLNDDCNTSENVIHSDHDSEWCTVTSKRNNRVFNPINTSDKTSVCHHEPYQQKQLPQQMVPTNEKCNATTVFNRNSKNRQQNQINIGGKNYNQDHGSFKRRNKFITGTSNKKTLSTVEKIDLFVSRLNPSTECDD